jgi:hypothetical protein
LYPGERRKSKPALITPTRCAGDCARESIGVRKKLVGCPERKKKVLVVHMTAAGASAADEAFDEPIPGRLDAAEELTRVRLHTVVGKARDA